MSAPTDGKCLRKIAAAGLVIGSVLGMTGTFVQSDSLRGLAWGIDGTSLVVAAALLATYFFRQGQDIVAAGYLVFAVGQGLVFSTSAMGLTAGIPLFGAGISLWAASLLLISGPRVYPVVVRILGMIAAALFLITALKIFSGAQLNPKTEPLPAYAYPVFVATMFGWVWKILR